MTTNHFSEHGGMWEENSKNDYPPPERSWENLLFWTHPLDSLRFHPAVWFLLLQRDNCLREENKNVSSKPLSSSKPIYVHRLCWEHDLESSFCGPQGDLKAMSSYFIAGFSFSPQVCAKSRLLPQGPPRPLHHKRPTSGWGLDAT